MSVVSKRAERPPTVLIEKAPGARRIQRAMAVVDLMLSELVVCDPRIERSSNQDNLIVTSEARMHEDILIVHYSDPTRPALRIRSRIGGITVRFGTSNQNKWCGSTLACEPVQIDRPDTLDRTVSTMRILRTILDAAGRHPSAYRDRTMRHARIIDRMSSLLLRTGVSILANGTNDARTAVEIAAPTPWSPTIDSATGPVPAELDAWGRMPDAVNLHMEEAVTNQSEWTITVEPMVAQIEMPKDPMEVLRILSGTD